MKRSIHLPYAIAESLIYAYVAVELENEGPVQIASRWPRVLEVLRLRDDSSREVYEEVTVSVTATMFDMLELLRSPQFRDARHLMHERGHLQQSICMLRGSEWDSIDEFITQEVKP